MELSSSNTAYTQCDNESHKQRLSLTHDRNSKTTKRKRNIATRDNKKKVAVYSLGLQNAEERSARASRELRSRASEERVRREKSSAVCGEGGGGEEGKLAR